MLSFLFIYIISLFSIRKQKKEDKEKEDENKLNKQSLDENSWHSDNWENDRNKKKRHKKNKDGMKYRNNIHNNHIGEEMKYDNKKSKKIVNLDAGKVNKSPETVMNSNRTTLTIIPNKKNQGENLELRNASLYAQSGRGTEPGTPLSTSHNSVENTPMRLRGIERKGEIGTPPTPTPKGFMNSPNTSTPQARTSPMVSNVRIDTIPNSPAVSTPGYSGSRGQFAMTSEERNQINRRNRNDPGPFFPDSNTPSQSRMTRSPQRTNGQAEDSPGMMMMSFTDRMGFLPNNDGIAYDEMQFRNDRNRSSTGCGSNSGNSGQRYATTPDDKKGIPSTPSRNIPHWKTPVYSSQRAVNFPSNVEYMPAEGDKISPPNDRSRQRSYPVSPNVHQSSPSTYSRSVMQSDGGPDYPGNSDFNGDSRQICRENSRGASNYIRRDESIESSPQNFKGYHGSSYACSDNMSVPISGDPRNLNLKKNSERRNSEMEEGKSRDDSPGSQGCPVVSANMKSVEFVGGRGRGDFDQRILHAKMRNREAQGESSTIIPILKNGSPSPSLQQSPLNTKNLSNSYSYPATSLSTSSSLSLQSVYQQKSVSSPGISTSPGSNPPPYQPSNHPNGGQFHAPFYSPAPRQSPSSNSPNSNYNSRRDPRPVGEHPTQQSSDPQYSSTNMTNQSYCPPRNIGTPHRDMGIPHRDMGTPHRDIIPSTDRDGSVPPVGINRTPARTNQPNQNFPFSPAPPCRQNSPESRNQNQSGTFIQQSPPIETPKNRTSRQFPISTSSTSPADDFSPAVASIIESWRTSDAPNEASSSTHLTSHEAISIINQSTPPRKKDPENS